MKKKWVLAMLMGGILIVGLTIVMNTGQGQVKVINQSGDGIPTADFSVSNPLSSQEREIRDQRGRKYKSNIPLEKMEDQETVLYGSPSFNHAPAEPAFPIEQSDMVILGTVTGSQAFISNDRSAVYCEFQVTVNKILKTDKVLEIAPTANIVVEREGGKVRFDSGRIQRRGEYGRNLPQKSREYVLFLKWDEPGKDFTIITGYEIQGQSVSPLDGGPSANAPLFRDYQRYRNAELDSFLSDLKEALNKSTGGIK